MLISSIVINNVLGIIYEVNLFYSADLGVMTSGNLFQLIPLTCFMYINKEDGYGSYVSKSS